MDYTPYSLLIDVGWISLLMVIGNVLRRKVGLFQCLLMPASITAGLLGLINFSGAVANFRRRAVTTQSSSSDARCGSAFSGSLEHPADDHRIRVRLPVGKHRALAFP
ncbi:putative transporter [Corynebacterium urealyticum DSM 7109]|uniref:Putative transporter n=1 Tax=Corynebacterium urealyticum (strain ATCC 43042 / DSM 7109) TaxID=504474 RepID=B1VHY9_CORU7|nr:putative transporter [Corynebacterium urealyticum DSM 7111]CAQ05789.1 putative transporter [Corynebacterium urealyticum DSM 7109]SNV91335.1 transporter [Corynebacterium urealyticum]